jgi:hypothetical protein
LVFTIAFLLIGRGLVRAPFYSIGWLPTPASCCLVPAGDSASVIVHFAL